MPLSGLWLLLPPFAPAPSFPRCREAERSCRYTRWVPPFLPVCVLPSWPRFSAWLPKKTKVAPSRFAYIYTQTRTHVYVWLAPFA